MNYSIGSIIGLSVTLHSLFILSLYLLNGLLMWY